MKRLNGKMVRSVGFMTGLVLILTVSSIIFSPKREAYNVIAVEEKERSINEEPENTLDVIFVGDSESYSGFSPLQIWAEYGHTSYVCGTTAQRLCDTYAVLQHTFEKQSPKLVVLETNCLYREAGISKETDEKSLKLAAEYFSVFQYHSRWKGYVPLSVSSQEKVTNERRLKGFRIRKTVKPYTGELPYMKESSEVKEVPELAWEYVEKINKLCQENHAELVLVSVPSAKNWNYGRHNGVTELARKNEILYLDLNLVEEIGINWKTDTKDAGDHLNFDGAKKVTRYIGKYFSEQFELTDHRGDERYQKWYEDCKLLEL